MTIDCIFWDLTSGTQTRHLSSLPLHTVLNNIGHQLAIHLYTITHFSATSSTISAFYLPGADVPSEALVLALLFATAPEALNQTHHGALQTLNLLKPDGKPTSFPSLSNTSFPPTEAPEPSAAPTDPEGLWNAAQTSLDATDKIALSWNNVHPHKDLPWQGATVGEFFGFGKQSTPSRIVAECCRQAGKQWVKVLSLTATSQNVTIVVECDESKKRMEGLFELLMGGGQARDQERFEGLKGLGLLE